jgi:hypothetical protein
MDAPSWMRWIQMGLVLLIAGGAGGLVLLHRLAVADWWAAWVRRRPTPTREAGAAPVEHDSRPDGGPPHLSVWGRVWGIFHE